MGGPAGRSVQYATSTTSASPSPKPTSWASAVIGVVRTNSSPEVRRLCFGGNDGCIRAVQLYLNSMAEAVSGASRGWPPAPTSSSRKRCRAESAGEGLIPGRSDVRRPATIGARRSIAVKIDATMRPPVMSLESTPDRDSWPPGRLQGLRRREPGKGFNEELTDVGPLRWSKHVRNCLVWPRSRQRRENVNIRRLNPRRRRRGRRLLHGHARSWSPERPATPDGQGHRHAMSARSNRSSERFGSLPKKRIRKRRNLLALNDDKMPAKAGEHRREHGQGPPSAVHRRSGLVEQALS
ncbi:hypothetical protein FQR65_LT20585 [Abscondita terminalis]|nr:hypothetical protein FQR65_LT20585 [Abscondita terminalis]